MGRGFLAGLLWGLVVAAGLVVLVSVALPPPAVEEAPLATVDPEGPTAEVAVAPTVEAVEPPAALPDTDDPPASPETAPDPRDLSLSQTPPGAAPPAAPAPPAEERAAALPAVPARPGLADPPPVAAAAPSEAADTADLPPAHAPDQSVAAAAPELLTPPREGRVADAAPGQPARPQIALAPELAEEAAPEPAAERASEAEFEGAVMPPDAPAAPRESPAGRADPVATGPAAPDRPAVIGPPALGSDAPASSGAVPDTAPARAADGPQESVVPRLPAEAAGDAAPESQPAEAAVAADAAPAQTSRPEVGFSAAAPGVVTDRLPRIGAAPETAADATTAPGAPAEQPALTRNRVPFTAPEGAPRVALLLEVTPDDTAQRAEINALPFPVSVAIDPAAPGADAASAAYRAAGREVVLVASEIPAGATAADLEVTFQAHFAAVPVAVAVLDPPGGALRESRMRAQQVGVILADGGYGLLTDDAGLNPAAQVADGLGLAHASVVRRLTEPEEVRPGLERAVFRATQRGTAIAVMAADPAMLSNLRAWHRSGRGDAVALAPVSAVLSEPE